MKIGAAVSNADPGRVFQDIYEELTKYHEVEVFNFRDIKSPIFYTRINRYLRRRDMSKFFARSSVVYFEWASDLLAYGSKFPKQCGIVTRLHRYEMFQWVPKINWDVIDKIILLTNAMQRKFITQCPEHADKTVVIPWAISPSKFSLRSRNFTCNIGTLCEIVPRKRIYELILVFSELVKSTDDINLYIGGSINPWYKDYYDALKVLVQKLGLQDKVIFHGKITDVPSWLQQIDIFVSNSYSEGLQSALIEAMASGCYCISHHWDGAEEILPEENLFLTDEELYKKVTKYFELSESKKEDQVKNMRRIVEENFDFQASLTRVREVIEDAGKNYL